jgi:hypothetical protein
LDKEGTSRDGEWEGGGGRVLTDSVLPGVKSGGLEVNYRTKRGPAGGSWVASSGGLHGYWLMMQGLPPTPLYISYVQKFK